MISSYSAHMLRQDPAYNVLGKTGIRGRATPKKKEPEEGEQVEPLGSRRLLATWRIFD